MPFYYASIFPYTKEAISSFTPDLIGVYGIYRDGLWIYVGRGIIRDRMLEHFNGDNLCINLQLPTNWVYEANLFPEKREKQLILELMPICNRRIG